MKFRIRNNVLAFSGVMRIPDNYKTQVKMNNIRIKKYAK